MSASSVAWIALAVADLQNSRSGPLVLGFTTTALATGQTDRVTPLISNTSEEILGAIGFSGKYTMDASYGTVTPNVIPPNLKDMAIEKVIRRLKQVLDMPLTAQESEDERTYNRTLALIREGRYPIDITNNPGNNISLPGGGVTTYVRNRSEYTRRGLSNLC